VSALIPLNEGDSTTEMTNPTPLVSVVIPAFNAAATLPEAVRSVLAQTYQQFEVIIADDGSSDDTLAITESFTDERVVALALPHGGVCRARNAAIKRARGRYLAFLDADDCWDPEKLERQLTVFETDCDDIAVVGTYMRYVAGDSGRVLGRIGTEIGDRETQLIAEGKLVPFAMSSAMMRREQVLAVGGFDEAVAMAEDLDLYQRMAVYGRSVIVPAELGAYRIHDSSISSQSFRRRERLARFVAARAAARAQGEELSFEAYVEANETGVAARYRELAPWFYRRAGESYASERWIKMVLFGLAAAVLSPRRTFKRLRQQRTRLETTDSL
jgi:glycosyltransferase involved in cell wall biosynthesis